MRHVKQILLLCLFCMIGIATHAADIPNNQIWYTYSHPHGQVIQPYRNDVFGAKILNNTYSNGKGIITFDTAVTSIGEFAFHMCTDLASIEIPNSVHTIGEQAFSNCSSLTSINIPSSVTRIERGAFWDCFSLMSVTLGNSVFLIGDQAFEGCSGLTSINIPSSVTSIGNNVLKGCSGLTSITVADDNKVYDSRNNCNAIIETASNTLIRACENTVIPNSVIEIGYGAFSGCYGLTSINIPSSVTSIEGGVFKDCSSLTSINILGSVTSIGYGAFSGCYGLTSINIPSSVTSIEGEVFKDCSSLTSINIPNYVTGIHDGTFSGCSSLTSVTLGNSVSLIGSNAFAGCSSLTSINIPNSVTEIDYTAFSGCSSLTSIKVADGNEFYDSRNNCNAIIRTASNTLICGCKNTVIPNSVIKIGCGAFSGCFSLASINIPNSVTAIDYAAFSGCSSLENIIADDINAPTIGSYCFNDVKNCSLHVPLGSEASYVSNFGTYFGEGKTNTIVPYSSYSRNNAAEYSFETWDASSDVELSEGVDKVYVPVEVTVSDLKYKRTFNNTDWQALYVPFELDVKNDLANFNVYEVSASSTDAINVTLITEGKTSANTPYLMKAKTIGEQIIPVSGKTVKVTVENTNSNLSDFEIVGTYEKLSYVDINGDWYALKGGKFMKADEGAYLNPYRFYLKRKSSLAKESIDININEPTGIETMQSAGKPINNGKHYNLQGIEVNENYNGMIIIKGKKYLKK